MTQLSALCFARDACERQGTFFFFLTPTPMSGSDDSEEEEGLSLITYDMLLEPQLSAVYGSRRNYYVSADWQKEFYVALAYRGFISVAHEQRGRPQFLLIPEIQRAYCTMKLGPEAAEGPRTRVPSPARRTHPGSVRSAA